MRVNTIADIDNSSIDCDPINPNPKKKDCPGDDEPDGTEDGVLFRGLSPKRTTLDDFDPQEPVRKCDETACGTDFVELDIDVGSFTHFKPTRPATAHFSVVLDTLSPVVQLGSNTHEH